MNPLEIFLEDCAEWLRAILDTHWAVLIIFALPFIGAGIALAMERKQ